MKVGEVWDRPGYTWVVHKSWARNVRELVNPREKSSDVATVQLVTVDKSVLMGVTTIPLPLTTLVPPDRLLSPRSQVRIGKSLSRGFQTCSTRRWTPIACFGCRPSSLLLHSSQLYHFKKRSSNHLVSGFDFEGLVGTYITPVGRGWSGRGICWSMSAQISIARYIKQIIYEIILIRT